MRYHSGEGDGQLAIADCQLPIANLKNVTKGMCCKIGNRQLAIGNL